MTSAVDLDFELFKPRHLDSSAACARALGWPSYAEPEAARTAFSAPGSITWVAVCNGQVIGLAHVLTNGVAHAHLSLVGVLPEYRRKGAAKRLIAEAFQQSGAKWLDLWSEPESESFYRSFQHSEHIGFRIYPGKPTA